ncbi:MAG: hypothetical protein RR543_00200 [Erysipelotrichales bacterium]
MNNNIYLIDEMFLKLYPDGLQDISFIEASKRHKVNNRILKKVEAFDIERLMEQYPPTVADNIQFITKLLTSCSMVSVFEKVAFKNYIADKKLQEDFLTSLYEMLNELNEDSFNNFVRVLSLKKADSKTNVAKWPIITFFLSFFNPKAEVFIKPTTMKKVAQLLEYDIKYSPTLNYQTYTLARDMVMQYKQISKICQDEINMYVQAIMYTVLGI